MEREIENMFVGLGQYISDIWVVSCGRSCHLEFVAGFASTFWWLLSGSSRGGSTSGKVLDKCWRKSLKY